jgi:hypothetical protein
MEIIEENSRKLDEMFNLWDFENFCVNKINLKFFKYEIDFLLFSVIFIKNITSKNQQNLSKIIKI